MAGQRVDGVGWISDDSSFYGDDETVAIWKQRSRGGLKLQSPKLHPAAKKRKIETSEKHHGDNDRTTTASPEAKDENHILDILRSRPQIAKLQSDAVQDRKPTAKPKLRTVAGREASELVRGDHFKGRPDAWQQGESINEFLKRLPVTEPETANVGPWLWVSSPQVNRDRQERRAKADPDAFIELGDDLKDAFVKQRSKIEAENPGKAQAIITRKMIPYRDMLEEDLLSAAIKAGTTCGKWMLFPNSQDLPRYWRLVAEATSQGKLGPMSKVATPDPYDGKDETLICVYTYDFTDEQDIRRVLNELLDLQLSQRDGKPIFYKCDAYTYMNITSNNDFKLRASLYSSAELLNNEAKSLKDGPIARLKKRNLKLDSSLAS